jgi:membrane protease YdiL (CAAX protease family)
MLRTLKLIWFALASLLLTLVPQGLWTGLLAANLKTGIGLPWAVPVMGVVLGLAWLYAGGRGPPARTSAARRVYRRANPVSAKAWAWALLANGLALLALSGLWIVMFQLVKAPGNPAADLSKYSPLTVAIVLVSGAVVGAVAEEVGIRGYLQGALERVVPIPVAIGLAALVLSPGHALTQGFVWSTLSFYVLVDIVYGATAYLTNSVYPAIVAHAAGLLAFFFLIWPHDAARKLVAAGGADGWFWIHVAQAVGFGAVAVWAFTRLAKVARPAGPRP